MKHVEAIILSMTPEERKDPAIINGSRRSRIAKRSGKVDQRRKSSARSVPRDAEDDEEDGPGRSAGVGNAAYAGYVWAALILRCCRTGCSPETPAVR